MGTTRRVSTRSMAMGSVVRLLPLLMCLKTRQVAASGTGGGVASNTAPPEDENPFKSDADSTSECYTWAADGQCAANPSYMLSSCKYSCWEWFEYRRKKYADAPIDKRFYCHSWAKSGECKSNGAFMKANCPESCKKH